MIRAYYNRQCDLPWSVDNGPGTEEHLVREIFLDRAIGYTVEDFAADNKNAPRAWLQFESRDHVLRIVDNEAFIFGTPEN